MTDFEEEPTDKQKKQFDELESFGDSNAEEFSGLQQRLGEAEQIKMMSTAQLKGDDKVVICLTDKRLIMFNSEKTKLLGKRNRFDDIRLGDIQNIQVEERKDFDVVKIETEEGEKKLMAPEGKGVQMSGLIRDQQGKKDRDPADQLEKIGQERKRGNISKEEYEKKKDDLMDRI